MRWVKNGVFGPKDSIFDPPHSTLSIGGIFGGIAHNVIADKCHINWETRPVVKEDGIFLNQEIDKYANEVLLPNMKKIFPNASIEKNIIGEIVGFDREDKSDACEFISSLTGDNSRQVVSFGTCLLYTSPSPRDATLSRMPSSA